MKTYKIYSLNDPITNEIKYIGYTSLKLEERLKDHLRESYYRKRYVNSHKCRWIRKLKESGLRPKIELIRDEICDIENTLLLEVYYIKKYKSEGYNLTNSTSGGEESKVFDPVVIDRIREGLKKYFKENSTYNKGKRMVDIMGEERYKEYVKHISPIRKEANSGEKNPFYGKKHTEESRQKMRENNKIHHVDIEEIKHLYLDKNMKQKEIAKIYGLNNSYICRILKKNNIKKEKKERICPFCGGKHVNIAWKNHYHCFNCNKNFKQIVGI